MIRLTLSKCGIDRFLTGSLPEFDGYSAMVDARGDGWSTPGGSKWAASCWRENERVAQVERAFDSPEDALATLNAQLESRGVQVARCIPFYPDRCSEIGCPVPNAFSIGPRRTAQPTR